jgi:hypothetical protein
MIPATTPNFLLDHLSTVEPSGSLMVVVTVP